MRIHGDKASSQFHTILDMRAQFQSVLAVEAERCPPGDVAAKQPFLIGKQIINFAVRSVIAEIIVSRVPACESPAAVGVRRDNMHPGR